MGSLHPTLLTNHKLARCEVFIIPALTLDPLSDCTPRCNCAIFSPTEFLESSLEDLTHYKAKNSRKEARLLLITLPFFPIFAVLNVSV